MSADHYMATQPIRAAIKARETDVLDALRIDWQRGWPHISCPYPEHADENPSWRWDESRARAYCSCIERSHSIFDVLMHVEGIDFEAAKLRVAEILARHDLIRARDGERRQAMDAASLLRPPADQLGEGLPRAYLAHRLGVAPDEVPPPATPAVGWRTLPYFDPPTKKGNKPKLVGHYPCVVFSTLAPDGRRHAHRIYVAPAGAGKADLGSNANGRPRDPKKSAKLREGQSAAGCVVHWGDPAAAPNLIVCEGIETGSAVALAHRQEIDAEEVSIAAALSTGGLRSFERWPNTRRITVAADRDEGGPEDDRGHRAGERAARDLALAHHEQIEVWIALPGAPGEDVDWLDVLGREGTDAVRNGIDEATRYAPTAREINQERERASRAAELAEIKQTYPLPFMESMRLSYRHTESGKVMIHKYLGEDKEHGEIWLPLTSPIGVPARLRAVDQQGATDCA